MSGNREGGIKAAETNKKEDPNFYKRIGALGGAKSNGGGFRLYPELAREAGRKGGMASRRPKRVK